MYHHLPFEVGQGGHGGYSFRFTISPKREINAQRKITYSNAAHGTSFAVPAPFLDELGFKFMPQSYFLQSIDSLSAKS